MRHLLLTAIGLVIAATASAQSPQPSVHGALSAQSSQRIGDTVHLAGNVIIAIIVIIAINGVRLTADEVVYSTKTREAELRGNVRVKPVPAP